MLDYRRVNILCTSTMVSERCSTWTGAGMFQQKEVRPSKVGSRMFMADLPNCLMLFLTNKHQGGTTLSLVNIEGWWGIIVIHVSDIDLPTSVVDSGACPDSIPPNMLGRVSSWGMAGMAMQDSSTTICYHVINGGLSAIFALMYHYFGHNHLAHQ